MGRWQSNTVERYVRMAPLERLLAMRPPRTPPPGAAGRAANQANHVLESIPMPLPPQDDQPPSTGPSSSSSTSAPHAPILQYTTRGS